MTRPWLIWTLIVAALVGTTIAALTADMAFDHNPQGEYADQITGAIHWGVLLPLVATNFVVVFLAVAMIGLLLYVARRLIVRR
jgi:hypothetical protein